MGSLLLANILSGEECAPGWGTEDEDGEELSVECTVAAGVGSGNSLPDDNSPVQDAGVEVITSAEGDSLDHETNVALPNDGATCLEEAAEVVEMPLSEDESSVPWDVQMQELEQQIASLGAAAEPEDPTIVPEDPTTEGELGPEVTSLDHNSTENQDTAQQVQVDSPAVVSEIDSGTVPAENAQVSMEATETETETEPPGCGSGAVPPENAQVSMEATETEAETPGCESGAVHAAYAQLSAAAPEDLVTRMRQAMEGIPQVISWLLFSIFCGSGSPQESGIVPDG